MRGHSPLACLARLPGIYTVDSAETISVYDS